MKLETFEMERFQSVWENRVRHNLSESGVHPLSVEELLAGGDPGPLLAQRLVYIQSNGSAAVREAIAALHPGATADHVVVANGTAEANYIAIWRLVEPGDEVVLMLPNYMQGWGVIRGQGATVVPWTLREERGWSPDLDELDALVNPRTRMIAVVNPNNPTGSVLGEEAMRRIVAAAARHGSWVLADEVYRGAERDRRETPTFFGTYDRVLVTGGLSKAYGLPGLRIGWVVGPPDTVFDLWARKDYLTISPGALSDLLARTALRPDVRLRIFERTRSIITRNDAVLDGWLAEQGKAAFRLVPPRAGAIAYLRYSWPVPSMRLAERLRDEESVLVVPAAQFGMEGYLRVGLGNEPEDLSAGLQGMSRVLRSLGPAPGFA